MRRWLGVRHSCLSYENHVGCWGADRAGAGRALSGAVIRGGDSQTCRASRNCDKRRNRERWREGGGRLRRRSLSRSVLRRFALIRRLVLVAAVDVRFCIGSIGALSARRGIALGWSAIRCAVGHRGFFDNLRGGDYRCRSRSFGRGKARPQQRNRCSGGNERGGQRRNSLRDSCRFCWARLT